MLRKYLKTVALTTSLLGCSSFGMASEGGGSASSGGTESFMAGAMPPPGAYGVVYNQVYSANKFKNDHPVFNDFKLDTWAMVLRGLYITDKKILGADWGVHAILTTVDIDITLGGNQDAQRGLSDLVFSPLLLGWHSKNLHVAAGIDIYAPIGSYKKTDLANISRNYWTFQPIVAATYITDGGYEFSSKWMYDYSLENEDTQYKSGQALHADYLVGKHFGPVTVGIGGYGYQQLTGDKGEGAVFGDFKGKAFSAGPQIRYQASNGVVIAAKYQKEFEVENRPEGEKFALDISFPF